MGATETRNAGTTALQRMVERRHAPGISYVVTTADELVFEGHAGVADAGGDCRVGPQTMFMACSITKVLTAIATLQLAERGELELDAPVSRYIDGPYGDGVTASRLLAHTSGVPSPMPLDWFFTEEEPMDHDAAFRSASSAAGRPVPPGRRYRYTNLGYWLLGRLIERVTGHSYADAITAQIFEPLGIDEESATFALPPASRLATGHSRKWSVSTAMFYLLTPRRYWATPRAGWSRFGRLVHHGAAYGGLYATARALATILADLLSARSISLSTESKRRMLAEQRTNDGKGIGGTLGWVTGRLAGHDFVGKQGGAIGFHGNVRLYPDAGLGTVVLANSTRVTPGPIDRASDELDRPFLEEPRDHA